MKSFNTPPSSSSPEIITLSHVDSVYDLSKEFFSGSREVSMYFKNEVSQINNIIKEKLGENYLGGFGLGYPFYAENPNGEMVKVKEIDSFIDDKKTALNGEPLHQEWVCPRCQESNNLPDLKSICSKCSFVKVKPRDVLKTIPDIDQLIVVNNIDGEVLKNVQDELSSHGYKQSDISIRDSINDAHSVLRAIHINEHTNAKLPIDLHLLSKQDFISSLQEITENKEPVVQTKSLRMVWESYNLPFYFDFIFSLKEIGYLDDDIKKEISKTRSYIKNNVDSVVDKIKNNSPRSERIFEDNAIEEILRDKIKNW